MPLFVTQGRFTREYIKGGLAKPEDRHAAISRLCEQAGGKLVSLYFTLGQYDFMVISEMPDAKAASILAFVAAGGGGIEGSVTTQAFTTAEARDMLPRPAKLPVNISRWARPDRRATHHRSALGAAEPSRTSRPLISTLPSSVSWRRRSLRSAMLSNRVRCR